MEKEQRNPNMVYRKHLFRHLCDPGLCHSDRPPRHDSHTHAAAPRSPFVAQVSHTHTPVGRHELRLLSARHASRDRPCPRARAHSLLSWPSASRADRHGEGDNVGRPQHARQFLSHDSASCGSNHGRPRARAPLPKTRTPSADPPDHLQAPFAGGSTREADAPTAKRGPTIFPRRCATPPRACAPRHRPPTRSLACGCCCTVS